MCEYCSCDPCQCEVLCPCGCGNSPLENCVYDTPLQRHVKNTINVLDDEQWVIDGMKAAQHRLHADAGESAASSGIVHASAESTSQAESAPTQRG